jgi:Plavaka transposase
MTWECSNCLRQFKNSRGLMVHFVKCQNAFTKFKPPATSFEHTDFNEISDDSTTSLESTIENEIDNDLIDQAEQHLKSGYQSCNNNNAELKSGVLLLQILRRAKAPLYLFDEIVDWARKSLLCFDVDLSNSKFNRKSILDQINKKYDLTGLLPIVNNVFLNGLKLEVQVITHDFKQCFYSLLNDKELMKPENLLDDDSNQNVLDDINSGSVYKGALKTYIKDSSIERLIPIIFFTDKTHTDNNGRLCLEPVQFTLGIFRREVRNNPKAWRTIGYVTDTIYNGQCTTEMKQQDYHTILDKILESYKKCQKKQIRWKFDQKADQSFILKIPTLFIIGDTEGHDKICGRMMSRSTINNLCRYCNIDRENIDDPFKESVFTKMSDIKTLVEQENRTKLNEMSMFCIKNAWHDIEFCDMKRGLHGATLAELLHCLQQGMFEYTIRELFGAKKQKKKPAELPKKRRIQSDEYVPPSHEELGSHNVFSKSYEVHFENLCKKYGKILQHQSDRSLPRTYFNSKYMSVTRKNGHEMAGMLLVYLVIFSSTEGLSKIDVELGNDRCAAYIHVFELLLMLESFCKQETHVRKDVLIAKNGISLVMNTIKEVLNRTDGCGMKIIKFHLMKHFPEDILRFGSMKNFDSSIGERNHCTEVKDPAKHTQRRKENFEEQTAKRYIENIAISIAETQFTKDESDQSSSKNENKHNNIFYLHDKKQIFKRDWKDYKLSPVKWLDTDFQNELTELCHYLVTNEYIKSPVPFFTQHNRDEIIFRGDPNWQETNQPWYDWAEVEWDGEENNIPAQIQIFIDLSNNFLKPFQIGQSFVIESGYYAIAKSFQNACTQKAHLISQLVDYGEFVYNDSENKPLLCFFSVDCITNSMVAVPYNTKNTIYNAREWLILKPKNEWYNIFISILQKESLSKNNS